MRDLQHPGWIWAKGVMLLGLGFLAAAMILLESPRIRTALLLIAAVWAFCRFYYFAFYVIQHYVDERYRYSGLLSLLRYALGRRPRGNAPREDA
jgi:hypothetical protein